MDGKPLAALNYAITRDPRTNRPALQAMIDVRTLAPRRHILRIGRAPLAAGDHDKARAWTITFWR